MTTFDQDWTRGGQHRSACGPEPWMLELAKMLILKDLPTGGIVGTASIRQVVKGDSFYEWHLTDVERVKTLRKPKRHPQPVWFTPF